jgi:hypothetical protein
VKQKIKKGKASGPIVGVISSISVTPKLKNAIMKGGTFSTADISVLPSLGYDLSPNGPLQQAISTFNKNTTIKVIITVGGGITYDAAAAAPGLTKKFVSVVGEEPTSQATLCYGGVNLKSCQTDKERVGKTLSQFAPAEIGLYYNSKSSMHESDNSTWPGGQAVSATIPNNVANFANDLSKFGSGIKAIIISPDPFFQDNKNSLIPAATNTGKYVCYALQDFGNGKVKPLSGRSNLHGPKLEEAYSLVGAFAANVINTGIAAGFVPCKNYVK